MKCPRGCETPLAADTLVGIEVDRCATCEGMWLDTGEGEIVTRPGEEIPQEFLDHVESLKDAAAVDTSDPLPCPRCAATMERQLYAKSKVEIDRCGCGVWLDKGELGKIRSHREQALEELREEHGERKTARLFERAFTRLFFDLGETSS